MVHPFILIHPPISKPCEPPAGVAYIAGALRSNHIPCEIIDLNIESIYYLINKKPQQIKDTWTQRAYNHVHDHVTQLRNDAIYKQPDSYIRAIKDINRVLNHAVPEQSIQLTLSDYHDTHLSPMKSADLFNALTYPEKHPLYTFWNDRLQDRLRQKPISGIGLSINYLSQALCGFSLMGILKKICPELPIWVGGGLITSWLTRPEMANRLSLPNVRFIAGPGEYYLLDYFNGKPMCDPAIANFDELSQNRYLSPGFVLPLSTSRGCYWRKCAFCPECAEKNPYTPMPINRLHDHLKYQIQCYHPKLIHFLDNALSPKWLHALIKNPPGVPWYGFVRITKHLTDLNFCHALKKSGCIMLKLGIESGDQDVLAQMKKGIDVSLAQKALKTIHQATIATYVYFLFGTPYETEGSCHKTFEFMVKNSQWMDFLNLAIFNLPMHSKEASQLKIYPFYEGDLSLYVNFDHPFGLSRSNIRQLLKQIKSHPDISMIVKRNPIGFTSNHAPFFSTGNSGFV